MDVNKIYQLNSIEYVYNISCLAIKKIVDSRAHHNFYIKLLFAFSCIIYELSYIKFTLYMYTQIITIVNLLANGKNDFLHAKKQYPKLINL